MPKLSWAFIAVAVPLLGLVGVSAWVHVARPLLLISAVLGAASLVLAGVKWMLDSKDGREEDKDKEALVFAVRDLSWRRGAARTLPLKRVV
jgi:threonine/homoserine/homoserine lactone efflux protein